MKKKFLLTSFYIYEKSLVTDSIFYVTANIERNLYDWSMLNILLFEYSKILIMTKFIKQKFALQSRKINQDLLNNNHLAFIDYFIFLKYH